jgi:hypothetical protein
VIKKIVIVALAVVTIGFAFLAIERAMWDYNESGVYFDGVTTYDTDAVVAYGFISGTLLVITIALTLIWKKTPNH